MKTIDLSALPEDAQKEVYDFFLLVKKRVDDQKTNLSAGECARLSEDSLSDWNRPEEDQAWKGFQ